MNRNYTINASGRFNSLGRKGGGTRDSCQGLDEAELGAGDSKALASEGILRTALRNYRIVTINVIVSFKKGGGCPGWGEAKGVAGALGAVDQREEESVQVTREAQRLALQLPR